MHVLQAPKSDLASVQAAVRAFQQRHDIAEDTMPTSEQMIGADRQDLVAAISSVGGIKKLTDSMQLHWSHVTFAHPNTALAAEDLKKYARQHQFHQHKAPSYAKLRQAGRSDLIASYRKYGQSAVVAAAGMSLNKGGRCKGTTFAHSNIALAAEDLKKYARQHQLHQHKAPSYAKLRQAGRSDLIASYRKYGQSAVVAAAGMSPNKGGRRKGTTGNLPGAYPNCNICIHGRLWLLSRQSKYAACLCMWWCLGGGAHVHLLFMLWTLSSNWH